MQSLLTRLSILAGVVLGNAIFPSAQQSERPQMTITVAPSEPIAPGMCTSSTFGYLELNGKRADFSDADFGRAIMSALRQGYVVTIYPPTKSGVFLNQDCHGPAK